MVITCSVNLLTIKHIEIERNAKTEVKSILFKLIEHFRVWFLFRSIVRINFCNVYLDKLKYPWISIDRFEAMESMKSNSTSVGFLKNG